MITVIIFVHQGFLTIFRILLLHPHCMNSYGMKVKYQSITILRWFRVSDGILVKSDGFVINRLQVQLRATALLGSEPGQVLHTHIHTQCICSYDRMVLQKFD